MEIDEKQQISYGKLITGEEFKDAEYIPANVKSHLPEKPYYLFIYVPAEKLIKVSIFPVKHNLIKKVLIRLKEFSPELVKGISSVLKNFELGECTIHTTGICFEAINCFYETYIDVSNLKSRKFSLDEIRKAFLEVPRIEEVQIIDINLTVKKL
ncbi:MAG: hypothetical protein ACTSVU_06955 [Promethearchaeota archaeon]